MKEQKYFEGVASNYFSNVDGQAGLAAVPSNFVDLVLTDPPYGIADGAKLTKKGSKIVTTQQAWGSDFKDSWATIDQYYQWLKPFIAEFVRVMKDNGSMILFLDRKYTGLIAHYLERDFDLNFKNKVYFKKKNPVPSIRKNNYRSTIEEAVWFTKGKEYTFNFGAQSDMLQVYEGPIGKKKTQHPTEKYTWMVEPLIRNHSKPGDVVLDAFAGSATTLVVAKQQDRHAIGFEKSTALYEMAKARIEAEQLEFAFHAPCDEAAIVRELDQLMDAELADISSSRSSAADLADLVTA
ncbi:MULTISPECIES: DNA-methyltransferase [Ralstonia solanacearum species complex]|uniref:Methyltransferase n=2 Tax=Ralstonia solanacearum TaxID=305 RepID=A0ABF7REI5_RALSL|nr:site-specific DNA-methyltransferase [Ralstonia solanacearum]ALF87492.1 Modification methylase DpnIIB [Ralstonia solanacearum]ATI27012.1 site-specific DNA-methyltransferase [Ralstonia solanacearum]ATJ85780.1 site-specific DNA-methyltransferase [Ralstonia solanacearum]EAP71600.1 adenine DNA methyltransferase-like protein [Ralstonia solanacearum UW551]MDN4065628.1 site-specific DNA-methyltransferase [Ralstonia solanacearum]